MTDQRLERKLIDYLEDAHAMERNVRRSLESMIETTEDEEMLSDLRHHHEETGRHIELIEERLRAHGKDPSALKGAAAVVGSFFKGLADMGRDDKPAKNARDGYVAEHLEIAAYELLERLARRAGDEATAEVARRNCADERAMADKIARRWDRVVDLTLAAEGVPIGAGATGR
jgi:ferritin-like metal-binding protein YciE